MGCLSSSCHSRACGNPLLQNTAPSSRAQRGDLFHSKTASRARDQHVGLRPPRDDTFPYILSPRPPRLRVRQCRWLHPHPASPLEGEGQQPSVPLCLCGVLRLYPLSATSASPRETMPLPGNKKALHLHMPAPCVGTLLFVSGTKSNQKGRHSDAVVAWFVLLVKPAYARCGWASCPSSRAAHALALVAR